MHIQSLNGKWDYCIGKRTKEEITVPHSALPVGHSEYSRFFDLSERTDKIFLKFDGITYYAKVTLNGEFLGEMLPYSEYEYDISDRAKEKNNFLLVEIEDLSPKFGPTGGWENWGGIIRDVSLIYRSKNYIENAFFHAELINDYSEAEFVVETKAYCDEGYYAQIRLFYNENEVIEYTQNPNSAKKVFLKDIKLWTFDNPELYKVEVGLFSPEMKLEDMYSFNVGFREISHDRHRFLLNGKPVFLRGVCKHEMIADSGHCPTAEQMEEEMIRIKQTGCNFVRLVHYPHNKKILDIADRLGIFVSEEPGLWWSDTSDPEVSSGSIEVLRRTILRDRNHACIAFWLCFNECKFTRDFLMESAKVCKKTDPTRMVSGANCMSIEETLEYYKLAGFDFYTMHPYTDTIKTLADCANKLNDKPLLFTEWGGYFACDNPNVMSVFLNEMNNMYISNTDEKSLAGAFFWCWAEINDFNRGEPACHDGNLHEGLVTQDRKPTMIYDSFVNTLKKIDNPKTDPLWIEDNGNIKELSRLIRVETKDKTDFCNVFKKIADRQRKGTGRHRDLKIGPVLNKDISELYSIPKIINNEKDVIFEADETASNIVIIGAVSMDRGYPISGEYGEDATEMIIEYSDGVTQKRVLKNGVDITCVYRLNMSSRINPKAENAERFAEFGSDKDFEWYVMNKLVIDTKSESKIKRIVFHALNSDYNLLIYGVFLN